MKTYLPLLAAMSLAGCASTMSDDAATGASAGGAMPMGGAVTVRINGVSPNAGPVLVALQDSASFAQAAGGYATTVTPSSGSVTATFQGVAPGSYAAAVVQDTNNDGTLTLGATGPTEPWGFSGTPQAGPPQFEAASFPVSQSGGSATVTLRGGR